MGIEEISDYRRWKGRSVPAASSDDFAPASATVAAAIPELPELPVLPSEAEDILSMSSRERQKWMSNGSLQSAGTRTVKLRDRPKA